MVEKRKDISDCRVLVTGGAGFIGSGVVWELNRRGCGKIVICDILGTSDKWRNLVPLGFEDYLEADGLLQNLTSGALGSFDHVFHLGACSATTERDASHLIRNNFEFTKDLARWALGKGARFTYASSAATYGDGSAGMLDKGGLDYLGQLRPLNMYGYSKHLFDLHARRNGMLDRIAGLKYFNVFGPNEDHKADMRSVVHKAFGQIRAEGVIRLFKSHRPDYKDGEQRRDFLYIKDAVAMTVFLGTNPEANGLFNVGSGVAHTWLDLANAVFAALGRDPIIEFVEMPEALREKYQYFTQADIGRLRDHGFDAGIVGLRDAVADCVRNYLVPDRRLGDGDGCE